jgi:hypothetical protein
VLEAIRAIEAEGGAAKISGAGGLTGAGAGLALVVTRPAWHERFAVPAGWTAHRVRLGAQGCARSSRRDRQATVTAPSNIAFIKYWGARDLGRVVPMNASISMTLTACVSLSTVAFASGSDEPDRIELAGEGRLGRGAAGVVPRAGVGAPRPRAPLGPPDGSFRW